MCTAPEGKQSEHPNTTSSHLRECCVASDERSNGVAKRHVRRAVGYHPSQLQALRDTINAADADVVVSATPCYLGALIDIDKPIVRARYEFAEAGTPGLGNLIEEFLQKRGLA